MPDTNSPSGFERAIRTLTAVVAIATLSWAVVEYYTTYRHQRELEHQANIRDSQKTFLERQLSLYFEATRATSTIATSEPGSKERDQATTRFWQLFWGELATVENGEVESAMVEFGDALNAGSSNKELQQKALLIACSARRSLATTWGVAPASLESKSCHFSEASK